jgi:hypothetical protein
LFLHRTPPHFSMTWAQKLLGLRSSRRVARPHSIARMVTRRCRARVRVRHGGASWRLWRWRRWLLLLLLLLGTALGHILSGSPFALGRSHSPHLLWHMPTPAFALAFTHCGALSLQRVEAALDRVLSRWLFSCAPILVFFFFFFLPWALTPRALRRRLSQPRLRVRCWCCLPCGLVRRLWLAALPLVCAHHRSRARPTSAGFAPTLASPGRAPPGSCGTTATHLIGPALAFAAMRPRSFCGASPNPPRS